MMSNVDCLAGYWIGGFGLGESMDERPALLDAVMVHLYSMNCYVPSRNITTEISQLFYKLSINAFTRENEII